MRISGQWTPTVHVRVDHSRGTAITAQLATVATVVVSIFQMSIDRCQACP